MTIDVADFCGTLQQDLADLAGNNYPAMKREATGFLDSLVSAENRSSYSQELAVDSGDGKKKQVIIRYIQPGVYSEVGTAAVNICDNAGEEVSETRAIKEVTRFRRSPVLTFTKESLRSFCDAPSEYRAKVLASRMSALFRSINRDLISLANAAVGEHLGGTAAAVNLQMIINEASGRKSADFTGEMELLEEMADLGLSNPFVVGSGLLSQYARLANIGCCNDFGQDMSKLGSFMFYRDRDVPSVIGAAQNFLVYAPGAAHLVTWNKNKGEFAMTHEHFAETTLVDPVTGLELDMEFNYDRCDKVWKLMLSLDYDLFTLPTNMFKDADERDAINYLWKFNATEYTPAP